MLGIKLIYVSKRGPMCTTDDMMWSSTTIQSGALMMWYNITGYCIHHYKDWGRIKTEAHYKSGFEYTKTPTSRPSGRAMGCLCDDLEENWPRYNGTSLHRGRPMTSKVFFHQETITIIVKHATPWLNQTKVATQTNRAYHSGSHRWYYSPGTLSFESSHCNSSEDRIPADEICWYPVFKLAAVTWQRWEGTSLLVPSMATRVT